MTESFSKSFTIAAICNNPDSRRSIVGITYFRNADQLETEAAADAIENAQQKLQRCPPCELPCQLKNLAAATPELVSQQINSNSLQIIG